MPFNNDADNAYLERLLKTALNSWDPASQGVGLLVMADCLDWGLGAVLRPKSIGIGLLRP